MIWIDLTNMPHARFFKGFIDRHDCLVTTREFGGLVPMLERLGIEHVVVGRHGGRDAESKIKESSMRCEGLVKLVSGRGIEVALSKQSVELPRVAFGLGIPCIQVVDNEHAEQQNRLSLPLASKIVVPEALDKKELAAQGAQRERILDFRGVCEASHIRDFTPDRKVTEKLGLGDYILLRPEPQLAAYFSKGSRLEEIKRELEDYEVVLLPRGQERLEGMRHLEDADALSLIYYARAVVGGGGTMNREAAVLGTPAISFYPQEPLGVDEFLIGEGLLHRCLDLKKVPELIGKLSEEKEELRKRAKVLTASFEDPFELIEKEIEGMQRA